MRYLKMTKPANQIPLDNKVSSIQPLLEQTSYDASSHYQNRRCDDSKPKGNKLGNSKSTLQYKGGKRQRCSADC